MKKLLFCGLFATLGTAATQAQSLKVSAYTKCNVALISESEISDAGDWWSAWQARKSVEGYNATPYTFKKMQPGTYVLVVHNPNADVNAEGGDGVVLESLVIDKKSKLSYDFKKTDFVDWNCLSCPWLYAFDGKEFIKLEEVIQDVVGEKSCKTTTHTIANQYVVDGKLRLRIQEEKDEISYLDQTTLLVDGKEVKGKLVSQLESKDKDYLVLKKGESVEIEFDLQGVITPTSTIQFGCNGFYEPDRAYLEAIFQKYQYKHN